MDHRSSATSSLDRTGRAWLFGGIFILLLLAAWASGPAQAEARSPQQSVPPRRSFLPLVAGQDLRTDAGCLRTSANHYSAIPILGDPRPTLPAPIDDPDINLKVRDWVSTQGIAGLINIGGDTHDDAPQLAHLFHPARPGTFSSLHQVYGWDWDAVCAQSAEKPGCRGAPIAQPEVTLVGFATTLDEPLYLPKRQLDILNGDYWALVLYAEETRLTLVYAREDSIARNYVLHLEDLCVDPNLLALYQQLHAAGRHQLPGLNLDVPLGAARGESVLLAIRDTGSFMDARSRKDWWQGY